MSGVDTSTTTTRLRLHHHQHRHQRFRAVEFSRLEGPNSRFVCRTRVYDAPVHVLSLQRDSYGRSQCTCMECTNTYRCVVSNGCPEREPTLYELVFCLLENAMNVLTRGYVYRRSKGLCVFRRCRDVLKWYSIDKVCVYEIFLVDFKFTLQMYVY